MTSAIKPQLMRVSQCAREIGVSPRTLYHWIALRKLSVLQFDKTIRVDPSVWQQFKASHHKRGAV